MFAAFLSDDMTYSCAIWKPIPTRSLIQPQATVNGTTEIGLDAEEEQETLEAAQMTKLVRFIEGAKIKGTDHVLEIGTGWGSFAIEAVRRTGCQVTSLTLSREQKELAERRIAAAGYGDKIQVMLCDYRSLRTPKVLYDKVISIEMLEAVGREYLSTYFECVDRLLKRNGGIAMFQCITMPEARYERYSTGEDFIRKYIFPGGHLPTVTQLAQSINTGSKGSLIIDGIENIGGHYAKTLRLWRHNFLVNFDTRIKVALMKERADMGEKDIEVFRRMWEVSAGRSSLKANSDVL
jgi:cyclopropane-fatty-acyl-phospholipid synthase